MRHDDTVSRNDRPTENGGAEVQYPARRLIRYKGDNREQGCGGRERRGNDDKASVEAVRKPADRPSQEKPAKGAAGHQDGNSAGIEAQPLRKDRAQSEECTCGHPAQGGRHQSEGRLLIQPFQADPGAPVGAAAWVRAIGTRANARIIATMQKGLNPAGSVAGRRSCPTIPANSPVMA